VSEELKSELLRLATDLDAAAEGADVKSASTIVASNLTADEPIRSAKEDRLNRTGFAKELARAITTLGRAESIVVGIYGKWGTGKTSLLNLVEEELEEVSPEPPLLFRFNPWGFSDQEQLGLQFFKDLSEFLRLHLSLPALTRVADTVEEYGGSLSPFSELLLPRTSKAVGASWNLLRKIKPLRRRTTAELKAEINNALRSSNTRLIVLIDDIDRLNTVEVRQAFQLIKLNANFSNTVFLVAFDNERVEKALEKTVPHPAAEYLEKIVQVAFVLPPIADSVLTQIILSNTDETLNSFGIPVDTQRFGNMFHAGFRKRFRTIRDVNRYFNLLRFAVGLVGKDTNFVDLAAMQALSLFYPTLYSAIQGSPELFIGYEWSSDTPVEIQKHKADIEAIFQQIPEDERENARSLTLFLFPKVRSALDTGAVRYGNDWEQSWRRHKQVTSKKYFSYYFHLAVPDTEISQVEFDRAVESASSLQSFVDTLRKLKETGRFVGFVGALRDSVKGLEPTQRTVVLQSIFRFGDEVDTKGTSGVLGVISEHIQFAMWLLFDLIDLMEKERFEVVARAMEIGGAPFTVTNFAGLCESMLSDEQREAREKYPDLTLELVNEMKLVALQVVHQAANDGSLANAPELPRILLAWKKWEGAEGPTTWVERSFLTDGRKAADFVSRFLVQASIYGYEDKIPTPKWMLSFQPIHEVADVEQISVLLLQTNDAELRQTERLGKQEFLKAKQKYDMGTDPDKMWHHDV
jgi:predicted KAP-like P-loop ATPase